jgi:predicted nucleotide-binding protein (sugar kinase/HSP70/actin superfamily)
VVTIKSVPRCETIGHTTTRLLQFILLTLYNDFFRIGIQRNKFK